MPIDAYRYDDTFLLHFDLPGVDPDRHHHGGRPLTVSVDRSWHPIQDAEVLLRERRQGTITPRFRLGDGLKPDKFEAGYDHGVLTLTVPVSEQENPRNHRWRIGSRTQRLSHPSTIPRPRRGIDGWTPRLLSRE